MKKIIASLLVSFISCSFYAQGIFGVDYNSKNEAKNIEESLDTDDDGTEYNYAKEIGIT